MTTSPFQYYYLSQLLNCRCRYVDETRPFGRLRDIGVARKTPYPIAVALEFSTRNGPLQLTWAAVISFTTREIVLKKDTTPIPPAAFWLRRDALDDQIVDISGAKVRRVNDIHMLFAQGQLVAGHAEVGIRGILRRLRIERPVLATIRWLFDYEIKEQFVTWRNVEVVAPGPSPGGLRVSVEASRFAEMHPAELADIMESLGAKERQDFFNQLPVEAAAEALQEADPDVQRTLVSRSEPGQAADILEEMEPRDAAEVLRDMYEGDAQQIISRMENSAAKDVKAILSHEEETAGALMSTFCITAGPDLTAKDAITLVQADANDAEIINALFVLDNSRRLLGILSLRDLLRAKPDASLRDIMTTNIITLHPDASLKEIAIVFSKYSFHSIPVVDEDHVFAGAIRYKSVRDQLPKA